MFKRFFVLITLKAALIRLCSSSGAHLQETQNTINRIIDEICADSIAIKRQLDKKVDLCEKRIRQLTDDNEYLSKETQRLQKLADLADKLTIENQSLLKSLTPPPMLDGYAGGNEQG